MAMHQTGQHYIVTLFLSAKNSTVHVTRPQDFKNVSLIQLNPQIKSYCTKT